SLTRQLVAVQGAWVALVIGASWQVLLDSDHGHVARWLGFRNLPDELRWVAVGAAVAAAVPVALRLLSLARISRHHMSRAHRLGLVALHLLPVPAAWAGVVTTVAPAVPIEAWVALSVPHLTAILVAWFGYPAPPTYAITAASLRSGFVLAVVAGLTWAAFFVAGRPLPSANAAAIQWSHATATNNIREWMQPWRAPWLADSPRSADRPGNPG
ncbi:MAG: hypothetical protein V2I67_06375, partial [Thermoanaerobaculales bacterium]|nr:hypothetical protein [Thermoanaerobaculales bacterium]